MPHKGYKPTPTHRRRVAESKKLWWADVRMAISNWKKPAHIKLKGTASHNKPDPSSTPIPPSASSISKPAYEQWGLYGYRENGTYYFLHERFDSLNELQGWLKKIEPPIPRPLWTYVKSGNTNKECFMPIRIPPEELKNIGHRFQQLKEKKK